MLSGTQCKMHDLGKLAYRNLDELTDQPIQARQGKLVQHALECVHCRNNEMIASWLDRVWKEAYMGFWYPFDMDEQAAQLMLHSLSVFVEKRICMRHNLYVFG